jgi:competence protein ComEC
MKRPILYGLAFFISGILLGSYGTIPVNLFYCLGFTVFCFCLYRFYRFKPAFIFLLFALLGFWRVGHSLRETITTPTPTVLTGIVSEVGYTASGNVRLTVRDDSKRVMAYLKPGLSAEVGQEVVLRGLLRPLEKPRYPGVYNEFITLRTRKIDAKMFPDDMEVKAVYLTPKLVLNNISRRLATVYDTVLPPKEASVVRSVTLGEKGGLDDDIAYLYRLAGIFHILSISGLHVAILMLAVKSALGFVMGERKAAVTALAVMVFYCLLTGAAVSTVRALTMCGLGIGAKLFFREYDMLASTAFACILLLFYEPLYLFNVGFQLSFSAVFGIAVLTAPLEHALTLARFPFRLIKKTLAVGIATVVATYPVLSFHFYEISTYSVLANLIVVPTAVALVVLGALTGLVGLLWMPAAEFLAGPLYYLLQFYEAVCRFFAGLPLAVIKTGSCGLVVVVAAYGVMLLFAYAFSGRGEIKPKLAGLATGTAVLAVCIILRAYPTGWDVTVLEGVSVVRHKRETVVVGDKEARVLPRYMDYIGLLPAQYRTGDVLFERYGYTIGFDINEPFKPVDVLVFSGPVPGEGVSTQAYIINGGNPWARAATAEKISERGLAVYDVSLDGAIRLKGTRNGIKIFAYYR